MKENCLNCNERYPACHDSCSVYAKFKKRLDKINTKHMQYMDGLGHDGCLAPKSGKVKRYDQSRFRY